MYPQIRTDRIGIQLVIHSFISQPHHHVPEQNKSTFHLLEVSRTSKSTLAYSQPTTGFRPVDAKPIWRHVVARNYQFHHWFILVTFFLPFPRPMRIWVKKFVDTILWNAKKKTLWLEAGALSHFSSGALETAEYLKLTRGPTWHCFNKSLARCEWPTRLKAAVASIPWKAPTNKKNNQ